MQNNLKLPSLQKRALVLQKCSFKEKRYKLSKNARGSLSYPTHVRVVRLFSICARFAAICARFVAFCAHFAGFHLWPKKTSVFNILEKITRFIKNITKCSFHQKSAAKLQKVLISLVRQKNVLRLKVQELLFWSFYLRLFWFIVD